MLYILDVILPTKRNFKNSITALYGIGYTRAYKLASVLGLHPFTKIDQVNQRQLNRLGLLIQRSFLIDFELKRKISLNITAFNKLKVLRGFLMSNGLPSRGQRTHTNGSTAKKLSKKRASMSEQRITSRFSTKHFNTIKKIKKKNKIN